MRELPTGPERLFILRWTWSGFADNPGRVNDNVVFLSPVVEIQLSDFSAALVLSLFQNKGRIQKNNFFQLKDTWPNSYPN